MPADYKTAAVHFEAGRYAEAAVLLDGVIAQGTKNEFVYRMAVLTYMRLKDYRKADQVQKEQVARIGNLNAKDRINMALLKTLLGKYDEAISYYKHLLLTGGNNKYNLNNYGYTLTLVERYEDAIPYLDQAIAIDNDFAYAYSNRGFAYLMISNPEQGKIDNDRSLALDPANPYAYRNIGIYLFSRGLYEEALVQLNKAKELEEDLPLVDHYIGRTHDWLEL
jgi:tetratricopeptide (TPR) repeat protein